MAPRRALASPLVALSLVVALSLAGCTSTDTTSDQGRTIVVAPDGSDEASGSRSDPLRTPQVAIDRLGPSGGTVVLRGGAYPRQRLTLRGVRNVTVRAASGERPVLDGEGATARVDTPAAVEIRDSSDVRVRGLDITGYRTTTLGRTPVGILVIGQGSGITLADNHVHDLGHDAQEPGSDEINAHGIAVYGTSARRPISDLTIDGNELDHLRLGASEALVVNGNVRDWTITDNHVHDSDNIGIDAIGFETTIDGEARYTSVNRARDGRVVGNRVSGISADDNPAYASDDGPCHCADGIYVDGGTDIEISDNVVDRSDIGIEVAAEDPKGRTNDVQVTDNVVSRSAYVGLAIGGYGPDRGEAFDVTVRGNRLRDNNTLADGSPQVLVQYRVHDSTITQNTVTSSDTDAAMVERFERTGSASQTQRLVLDQNTYGSPAAADAVRFTWFGESVDGFAAWRRLSGQDADSTYRRR